MHASVRRIKLTLTRELLVLHLTGRGEVVWSTVVPSHLHQYKAQRGSDSLSHTI
jgi:hypothetical protein